MFFCSLHSPNTAANVGYSGEASASVLVNQLRACQRPGPRQLDTFLETKSHWTRLRLNVKSLAGGKKQFSSFNSRIPVCDKLPGRGRLRRSRSLCSACACDSSRHPSRDTSYWPACSRCCHSAHQQVDLDDWQLRARWRHRLWVDAPVPLLTGMVVPCNTPPRVPRREGSRRWSVSRCKRPRCRSAGTVPGTEQRASAWQRSSRQVEGIFGHWLGTVPGCSSFAGALLCSVVALELGFAQMWRFLALCSAASPCKRTVLDNYLSELTIPNYLIVYTSFLFLEFSFSCSCRSLNDFSTRGAQVYIAYSSFNYFLDTPIRIEATPKVWANALTLLKEKSTI